MVGRRRTGRVAVFALGEEPGGDISSETTAGERLALMWPLAIEAWSLTGRPLPDYERASTPVRVVPLERSLGELPETPHEA